MIIQIGNFRGRDITSVAEIGLAIREMQSYLGRALSDSELELYHCAFFDLKRREKKETKA
jgi:hypothetical protein